MNLATKIGDVLRKLHWKRGLRAGLAVAGAMTVCHVFSHSIGWAAGWAALGGFEAILVDNGGPYRSRFATISTLVGAGAVACLVGAAAMAHGAVSVLIPMGVTALFCFVVTFARVIAQPIASTSVIILVIYFAALGSGAQNFTQASWYALAFVLGGVWAAILSLILWPIDPFRPARLAVASCYLTLAEFPATIAPTERDSEAREIARQSAFEWQRRMRTRMEAARSALATTAARSVTRTHRARNLTVLLETADMLLAVTMRATELALAMDVSSEEPDEPQDDQLRRFVLWLSEAERSIAHGLQRRPSKGQPIEEGMRLTQGRTETRKEISLSGQLGTRTDGRNVILHHLAAAELEARQNVEIACEAVKAIWRGVEVGAGTDRLTQAVTAAMRNAGTTAPSPWAETVRANWTLDSVMMRHALRVMVVGAIDVLLLRRLHLSHGYWLAMTSIIVLQPYQSHTFKRGVERVGGTVAGGILAALLAAAIPSEIGILVAVTATSVLTLATFAVDYAWYCFFLTPTFVLMGLPRLGDWEYSGVRILTTFLGAAVAVAAMRLLWPEGEHDALGKLLGRSAAADRDYLRAMLHRWQGREEREALAAARRSCGLASNEAEEALDRLRLETGFGRIAPGGPRTRVGKVPATELIEEHALTFVTYIRRLTQSITTLAVLGDAAPDGTYRVEQLVARLETMSSALTGSDGHAFTDLHPDASGEPDSDIAVHQLQRMERQVSVLERAAFGILGAPAGQELTLDRHSAGASL